LYERKIEKVRDSKSGKTDIEQTLKYCKKLLFHVIHIVAVITPKIVDHMI